MPSTPMTTWESMLVPTMMATVATWMATTMPKSPPTTSMSVVPMLVLSAMKATQMPTPMSMELRGQRQIGYEGDVHLPSVSFLRSARCQKAGRGVSCIGLAAFGFDRG
jgi:hypothetical protein